jgi:hypothetical protein
MQQCTKNKMILVFLFRIKHFFPDKGLISEQKRYMVFPVKPGCDFNTF